MKGISWWGVAGFILLLTPGLWAEDRPDPLAKGIQDNSFLVEEAYNQEAGVVQHIFGLSREINKLPGKDDRDWNFGFTQEWPFFSQRHQVSYSVPYSRLHGAGGRERGGGDIMLNYRYQALFENDSTPAFAPRLSLILPTGDEDKGLSDDTLGYQINLPLSKIVHNRLTLHANAGMTLFPDLNDRNPLSYSLGGSAIYAVTRDFNLMLEVVGEWSETVERNRKMDREFSAILAPGARYALNLKAGQLVLGVAALIGLNHSAPDYGAFFYLSWEHRFRPE